MKYAYLALAILIALNVGFLGMASDTPEASSPPTTVILLHGILNRPFMMKKIERHLERAGFRVVNWGYDSRSQSVEAYAAELNVAVERLGAEEKVHFVGFSLGAIVIRYYLTHYSPKNVGRFVMIAPPNHGSEWADRLYPYSWFRFLYGDKAIRQLKASNKAFFEECGIPANAFGIIAGGRGDERGFSRFVPGDDDGSVSIASAKLLGAADFVLLPHRHTSLLFQKQTAQNVLAFIQSGHFIREKKN